ncbi:hypothetical protein BDV93DRAFT_573854 [Ceratobasidium sp. AG-I]|nr:hypothetical protein BDV93DRAFT_573854 [Ceratobasidium sp. AG-I]
MSRVRGATGLHSRSWAFVGNIPLLGRSAITDRGCRDKAPACSWRVGGVSGLHSTASTAGDDSFPVVLVGSGKVMFRTIDGPWNHSLRLERKLGKRLRVLGVVDPNADRAREALATKHNSPDTAPLYANAHVYNQISDIPQTNSPKLIVMGSHPFSRGTDISGRDSELQIKRHFPGVPMLVEKPVSVGDVPAVWRVADQLEKGNSVVSVAYMFRYLKAVQQMKKIIQDNKLEVMGTNSRYYGAYLYGDRLDWWDKSREQGPVVEQATHFCDLARYFGGNVDLSTVSARTAEWHERPGKLSRMPVDESLVAPENRIPRATSAIWKYKSGAIGSLTHVTILQGTLYACEFEVYCDGYTMRLSDPYGIPTLHIRQPGQDYEEVTKYENDDPFYSEVSSVIDVVEGKADPSAILSSYQDACQTYELTRAIREVSERAMKPQS